ncbi:MAG: cytochrome c-type biogenesis protein CcmH [Gemmatimonadetes bacterium]|nr:cytochrome c-type biogenesis protein CcmH [Gemmatimonadota bacterium]
MAGALRLLRPLRKSALAIVLGATAAIGMVAMITTAGAVGAQEHGQPGTNPAPANGAGGADRPEALGAASVPGVSGASPTTLDPAEERRAQALEGRLKCPVCRTQSVRESTSFMALEMRAKVRERIAAGDTDEEVLQFFVDRYGDYILLEPRKEGFGLVAYVLPFLAVLSGGVLLVLRVRRARVTRGGPPGGSRAWPGRGDDPAIPDPAALEPAAGERLERELKRYSV